MAHALFADRTHHIYDHPDLELAGQSGRRWVAVDDEDLVPLPEGTKLFALPGRWAVGWNAGAGSFSPLRAEELAPDGELRLSDQPLAVSAFLPAGRGGRAGSPPLQVIGPFPDGLISLRQPPGFAGGE